MSAPSSPFGHRGRYLGAIAGKLSNKIVQVREVGESRQRRAEEAILGGFTLRLTVENRLCYKLTEKHY